MGTVDYMAPEQARDSKSVDHRADMYSLGCTLYFLATGAPPAPPGSAAEKLLWHQTIHPLPLSEVCPQATPRLTALVERLIAKQPENRPASMDEIAAELDACAAEFPAGQAELAIGEIALSHDHTSSTMGGSAIHATQRELGTGLRPKSLVAPPVPAQSAARKRSRWLATACGVAGLAAVGAILAAPFLNREPASVPTGPTLPAVVAEGNGKTGDPLPSPISSPPRLSPHAPYLGLVTWVVKNGGSLTVITGKGQQLTIVSETSLPNEALEIIAVRLNGTGVRDTELAKLAQAPGLRELSLADTQLTDAGLAHLQSLRQLTHLDLSQTEVSSAGLRTSPAMHGLSSSICRRRKVTDPGLTRLGGLPNLERLYLSDTSVTDVGTLQLGSLPALKLVALHGTGLSAAGQQALQSARPDLEIAWDGADLERLTALRLLDAGVMLRVVDRAGRSHDNVRTREALPPGRVVGQACRCLQCV